VGEEGLGTQAFNGGVRTGKALARILGGRQGLPTSVGKVSYKETEKATTSSPGTDLRTTDRNGTDPVVFSGDTHS